MFGVLDHPAWSGNLGSQTPSTAQLWHSSFFPFFRKCLCLQNFLAPCLTALPQVWNARPHTSPGPSWTVVPCCPCACSIPKFESQSDFRSIQILHCRMPNTLVFRAHILTEQQDRAAIKATMEKQPLAEACREGGRLSAETTGK